MKNFFKSLAICALAALTFASCQKENADGNMDDQSSVVSINLTSPLMGTKAFADGNTVNFVLRIRSCTRRVTIGCDTRASRL